MLCHAACLIRVSGGIKRPRCWTDPFEEDNALWPGGGGWSILTIVSSSPISEVHAGFPSCASSPLWRSMLSSLFRFMDLQFGILVISGLEGITTISSPEISTGYLSTILDVTASFTPIRNQLFIRRIGYCRLCSAVNFRKGLRD